MQRSPRAIVSFLAALILCTVEAAAQAPSVRVGLGTMLTRDRGWNYHESLEFVGTTVTMIGSVEMEAGGSVVRSFAEFTSPAVDPPATSAFRDGFGIRVHFRAPAARKSSLSALAGAEYLWDVTDINPRTTPAAMIGAGWSFGPRHQGALDLRYVAFAKRLGTSKGILALTLGWRL